MSFSSDFFAGLLPTDPIVWLQIAIFTIAGVLVYLLLFTLRDILLRSRSFWYQFFCVLLVGCVPFIGFFLYLLIRPARTVKERDLERMLHTLGLEAGEDPSMNDDMLDEQEEGGEDEDEENEEDEEDDEDSADEKGEGEKKQEKEQKKNLHSSTPSV